MGKAANKYQFTSNPYKLISEVDGGGKRETNHCLCYFQYRIGSGERERERGVLNFALAYHQPLFFIVSLGLCCSFTLKVSTV